MPTCGPSRSLSRIFLWVVNFLKTSRTKIISAGKAFMLCVFTAFHALFNAVCGLVNVGRNLNLVHCIPRRCGFSLPLCFACLSVSNNRRDNGCDHREDCNPCQNHSWIVALVSERKQSPFWKVLPKGNGLGGNGSVSLQKTQFRESRALLLRRSHRKLTCPSLPY